MNSRLTPDLWMKCSTLIVFATVFQLTCNLWGDSGPQLLVPDLEQDQGEIRQVNTTDADNEEPLVAQKPEFSIEARKPELIADDATDKSEADKKTKKASVPEPKPFPGIAQDSKPSMKKPEPPPVPEIVDPLDKLVGVSTE